MSAANCTVGRCGTAMPSCEKLECSAEMKLLREPMALPASSRSDMQTMKPQDAILTGSSMRNCARAARKV